MIRPSLAVGLLLAVCLAVLSPLLHATEHPPSGSYHDLDYVSDNSHVQGGHVQVGTVASSPISYHHMSLYQLKQLDAHRAVHHSGETADAMHIVHSHNHWGSGWGYGGHFYQQNQEHPSFSSAVADGVIVAAATATVLTLACGVYYGVSRALYSLWPYEGAASLTAIELPGGSAWHISGYRVANGVVVRDRDFTFNTDAQEVARESGMFDRDRNREGRFLLIDQENWWGIVDNPTDIDVIFTRNHPDGGHEEVTVNFVRHTTNAWKPGIIQSRLSQVSSQHPPRRPYRVQTIPIYPKWLEFSRWYHQPTRVLVDFPLQSTTH